MRYKHRSRLAVVMVMFVAGFMFTFACNFFAPQESDGMDENVVVIKTNTVFEYENIKIGVGNIRIEEYEQQNRNKTKGYTAGVYVYHKTDPTQDRSLRVYAGYKDAIAGYDIEILDVNSASVKLKIKINSG